MLRRNESYRGGDRGLAGEKAQEVGALRVKRLSIVKAWLLRRL